MNEKQIAALQNATYVGMTPDQQKDFDGRRTQIAALMKLLNDDKIGELGRANLDKQE